GPRRRWAPQPAPARRFPAPARGQPPRPMPREASHATTLTIQGTQIPKLGFGTWQLTGRACEEGVRDALELGYRHVDTARAYGNEAQVGRAIAASGVERRDIFLTTKVWYADLRADDLRSS